MDNKNYSQLLNRLLSIEIKNGMKLGLDNSLALSRALDDPHQIYRTIHIAGTNGKGSVSTKTAAALQASGLRTGLYTSPHISTFRERIRIDGQMISEDDAARGLERIFSIVETLGIPATFFEITTLLAFAYFAEKNVDAAVIETGIGGRLDATNIIHPELSVITSISLEHTDMLGETIEAITKEKAGIIKASSPVVIGPTVPFSIISPIADALKSPCFQVQGTFEDFHIENNAIAKEALKILGIEQHHIDHGLLAVPPCRTEIVQRETKTVVLDVAHNPAGMSRLLNTLKICYPQKNLKFVMGFSQNKDIPGCLEIVKDHATHFHLVEADTGRAAPKELLREHLLKLGVDEAKISCEPTIAGAIQSAFHGDEIIVICGTFFIMGQARHALGFNEPQDGLCLSSERL